MEGEALVWFQDADEAGQFPTWDAFLQALLTRFGHVYDDPMESLVKLRQTTTVTEYATQFEANNQPVSPTTEYTSMMSIFHN
jgi:hypothetical protein